MTQACAMDPLATAAQAYCPLPSEPLQGYASMFVSNDLNLAVLIGCVALALGALALTRMRLSLRQKTVLVYAHIALLIFPFIFILLNQSCQQEIFHCNLGTFAIGVPAILTGLFVSVALFGAIAFPSFYRAQSRHLTLNSMPAVKRVRAIAKSLRWKAPDVYALDSGKPQAFAFTHKRPSIFVSIGMMEVLSDKELEAVLLHELWHTHSHSAMYKISALASRMLSPFAAFSRLNESLSREETEADQFASRIQRTHRFVDAAKRKIEF